MQAGVTTACLYPKPTEDALYDLCMHGAHTVEIFLNAPSEATGVYAANCAAICAHYGARCTAVHGWTAPLEPYMLFSRYQRRFTDFLEEARHTFAMMQTLGAEIYILHGATQGSCRDMAFYCERFHALYELGKTYGVTVTQENVHRYESQSLRFLREFCRTLGDEAAITLDTKQAVRAGLNPLDVVESIGTHIRHVHLSDHGDLGDCLRIGKGRFPMLGFLTALRRQGYDGTVSLELYRDAFGGVNELIEDVQRIERMLTLAEQQA